MGPPDLSLSAQHPNPNNKPPNRVTVYLTDCGPADLAPPLGIFNIDDMLGFLDAFASGSPDADLASPAGTLDADDILAFLAAFSQGCR